MKILTPEQIEQYVVCRDSWGRVMGCFITLLQAQAELTRDEIDAYWLNEKRFFTGLERQDTDEEMSEKEAKEFDGVISSILDKRPLSGSIEYPYLPDKTESSNFWGYANHYRNWKYHPGIECVCEFKPGSDYLYREFYFDDGTGYTVTAFAINKNSLDTCALIMAACQKKGYTQIG